MLTTIDQNVALIVGAVLLAIFQIAKFAQVNVADPATSRLVSMLPSARAQDFTGRRTYWLSLGAFLAISLTLYYYTCQISPHVLQGIARFGNPESKLDFKEIPYPLYISALFMGLTQPVLPAFPKIGDSLRTFIHDQIEIPRRVVDLSESLTAAINDRSGANRARLKSEINKLIGDDWLLKVDSLGDLAFYRTRLDELGLGDPTTAGRTLKGASTRELRDYVEKLVLFNLIAVMRKSGPGHLAAVAKWSQTPVRVPRSNFDAFLLSAGLAVIVFGFLLIGIWLALREIPPDSILAQPNLWPITWNGTDYLAQELQRIVPAIFFVLVVSIYMLPNRRDAHRDREIRRLTVNSLGQFALRHANILITCFLMALAIHFAAEAFQTAVAHKVQSLFSLQKAAVIFVRTAPSVTLSYLMLLYLERRRIKQPFPFAIMLLIVAAVTAIFSFLVAEFFLADFLPDIKDVPLPPVNKLYSGSGIEYAIFYVVANVLVAECAFITVALFFHTRTNAPQTFHLIRTKLQLHRP